MERECFDCGRSARESPALSQQIVSSQVGQVIHFKQTAAPSGEPLATVHSSMLNGS